MHGHFRATLAGLAISCGLAWAEPAPMPPSQPLPTAPPVQLVPQDHSPGAQPCESCVPSTPCQLPGGMIEFGAEFLYWRIKDGPSAAPLATVGDVVGVGALGQPGTTVVFGGEDFDYNEFSGIRLMGIWWLDHCQTVGIQARGFALEGRTVRFATASDPSGDPLIARPLFDPLTNTEFADFVSLPTAFAGGMDIATSSRLWGAEMNLLSGTGEDPSLVVKALAGVRYLDLGEDLHIVQHTTLLANGMAGFDGAVVTAPSTIDLADAFHTRNQFYGGQLGLTGQFRRGQFLLDLAGKLALGTTQQTVSISGGTMVSGPGPSGTAEGGVLALRPNIGKVQNHAFTLVPEVNVNVGYELTDGVSVFVGYTFLYWSTVVRPGEQVERGINPAEVPTSGNFAPGTGVPLPQNPFRTSDFWAQGLNVGVSFRY